MKTVKWHLQNAEKEQLINIFLYKHPVNLHEIEMKHDDMTIGEAKARSKAAVSDLIDHLLQLKVEAPKDKTYFLMAHARVADCIGEVSFSMLCLEEVMQSKQPEAYGYVLLPQSEVMGCLVADNEYTQKNILDLLADVLYEISFFGMKQEGLGDFIRELDEARQELASESSLKEFSLKLDLEYGEPPAHRKLERETQNAIYKYERKCMEDELELFRNAMVTNGYAKWDTE